MWLAWLVLGTVFGSFATWCCVWAVIRSNDLALLVRSRPILWSKSTRCWCVGNLAPGSDKYATLDAAVRAIRLADERLN